MDSPCSRGPPWPAYLSAALVAAGLFLASLLAHELAHALVAQRFDIHVERIILWLLGGVTEFRDQAPADLLVAGAGPPTSVAAGLCFAGATIASAALHAPAVVTAAFGWLALINVVLAVFNPLPGAPGRRPGPAGAALAPPRRPQPAAVSAAGAGHGLGMLLIFAGAYLPHYPPDTTTLTHT